MNDETLARTLTTLADRTTADLHGPDDAALAHRAAHLGRRRLRSRTALRTAGTLVAAGALTVAGMQLFPGQFQRLPVVGGLVPVLTAQDPTKTSTYDPYAHFMDEPSRGPLADDMALRDKAFAAWATAKDTSANRTRGLFDDLRGEPHLVWAGNTPNGPAAVVAQDAYLHPHEDLSPEHVGPQTLLGYVTTGTDGALHLVADDYGPDDGQTSAGHGKVSGLVGTWLDEAQTRLLVVDPGYPLAWSWRYDYGTDGSARRTWQPVAFTDGAAVLDLPAGARPEAVRVARAPVTDFWDLQQLGPGRSTESVAVAISAARLPWAPERACVIVRPAPIEESTCVRWGTALADAREAVTSPGAQGGSIPEGYVMGRTPDGRTFVVGTSTLDTDPAHLVAGLFTGDDPRTAEATGLVDPFATQGTFDPAAPLPVAVRLPDAQGWVVANVGATLRYRTGPSGAWRDAGSDAALLPDADHLQVEVTPAGGAATVVTLGG